MMDVGKTFGAASNVNIGQNMNAAKDAQKSHLLDKGYTVDTNPNRKKSDYTASFGGKDEKPQDKNWYLEYNNSTNQNINVTNKWDLKNTHIVAETDSNDNVNLQGKNWQTQKDVKDSTGRRGTLYFDDKDNQVLITGGAKVNFYDNNGKKIDQKA